MPGLAAVKASLGAAYCSTLKSGLWRDELVEVVVPRAGERILVVSTEGCDSCAEPARQYPTAHFATAHPKATASSAFGTLNNLDHLLCREGRIHASGASFDNVVCALARRTLHPREKVAQGNAARASPWRHAAPGRFRCLMHATEGKRSARHRLPAPTRQRQAYLDDTWFNMIEQAGFAGARRVKTCSEIEVAVVRARRS
jgi:hypothetical protein